MAEVTPKDTVAEVVKRRLDVINSPLIRAGAIGGSLGGAALFLLMGGYYAANGSGFASMLSFCFAGFVYSVGAVPMPAGTGAAHGIPNEKAMSTTTTLHQQAVTGGSHAMGTTHSMGTSHAMGTSHGINPMMMASQPTSHLVVGAVLHTAFSVFAGVAFAVVLALLVRAGLRFLMSPAAYVLAGAAGGALLYAIMIYLVAPGLNSTIVEFTPLIPFFFAHLLYGATVGGFVYWRRHHVPGRLHVPIPVPSAAE